MHRPIFGHSFAVIVAPILLSVLAFNFLNRKRTSTRRNAEDTGSSSSSTVLTETSSGASVLSTTRIEASDSASSSSNVLIGNYYDVFLSFGGIDTRDGFTSHLYNGLMDAGISTFLNNNEIHSGKEIGPDLSHAIMNSKILIPILSVNYGSSKYCLDELVQIMECKKGNTGCIVLPIFYKVEPVHVRYQCESFGAAFKKCKPRYDGTILEKWRQALEEVSLLKGWEAEGSEGQLVKSIVREVLRKLKIQFNLATPETLVGIDSHVENIMEFVKDKSHASLFIGIHGMGGIGKTTLAKLIYNKLSNQFENHSFIADIRESSQRNGLEVLQSQLISDILNQRDQVYNQDQGTKLLSSIFKNKKVLILLDDVDDNDQWKALAGHHNWFSSGSRILITSRDKKVLDNAGVDYNYEHKELDKDHSLILFSKHAFLRDTPPSEFKELTHDVVSTSGGLPISLEVVGSYLYGKRLEVWRDTISKLRNVPHKEVQKKLRISFDGLDDEQRQIFLDIACFFNGTDARIASYMWDDLDFFPLVGIEELRYRSLIKVGDNNELKMHDQLRDLGRNIVRQENVKEPQYRSRLWDSKEVLKVLEGKKGTEMIEAISTEFSRGAAGRGGDIHTDEQLKNLKRLRILLASGAHFCGDFENSITELRWLRWRYCPLTFKAKNFPVKKLTILDLSRSEISDQWQGWSSIMMAEKLKFLDLTLCRSLRGTFFLSAFKNLEVLILQGCEKVEQIDSSIGDMRGLVSLDLTGCRRLQGLPAEVGKLQALEKLLLKDCRGIFEVPDNIGALENLEILNISNTGIKALPNGVARLKNLQVLDASSCTELGGKMPKSIRDLSSLQHLDFRGCQKLQWLPELPSNLTYLNVTYQSRILPSLSHLIHLKELQLFGCKVLECISELPSTLLELSECSQLTDPDESELPRTLNLPFKLEILKMCSCNMKTLDLSHLSHLRTLSIEDCTNLLEIRGLNKLNYLESLIITKCTSIERLDLLNIEHLRILHADYCEKLVEIQGLDRLEFLMELSISWCALIERLDLTKAKGLKILIAKYCKSLVEIQGLERFEFLEELNISRCVLIERLDLSKIERLKILEAKDCEKLVEIQGLDRLKFLEKLDISWWASIERLDLQESKSLKTLNAKNCKNLVNIQDLDKFEFLEELNVSGCASIERLDLPKSKDMKLLNAKECKSLVKIQGLDKLEFLEELDVSKCASIERLDLSKCERMKTLYYSDCEKLVEIRGMDSLGLLKGDTSLGAP